MMKKRLLLFLLFLAAMPAFSAWKNSLKPQGPSVPVRLKDYHSIIIPMKPDSKELFAAGLLNSTLEKITGVKMQITNDPDVPEKAFPLAPQENDLGTEGYRIRCKKNRIVFSGGTRRSSINAVIAFLEEDIGVRWYVRDEPPVIPVLPDGEITVTPRSYTPHLVIRSPFYWDAFCENFELYNRTNHGSRSFVREEYGGSWNFPPSAFCHTFSQFLPNSLFDEHPEYFALINGNRTAPQPGGHAAHLCMTNPEVVKIVAEKAIERLKEEKPEAEIISISQNDGRDGFCECPQCNAFAEHEGSVSGPLLDFVNKVAEIIHQEFPDVTVETFAYVESFYPPKTIRPGKKVMIRLCSDSHVWAYPLFYFEDTEKFYGALRKWHELGAELLIWDYTTNFGGYLLPRPNLQVVDHDLDVLLANGARGIMLQGSYQGPGGADAPLMCWIFAKRLWNPQWELEPLLDDFLEGYFGKAAPVMREYYAFQKKLQENFRNRHKNHLKEKNYEPPDFEYSREEIAKMKSLLDSAVKVAAGNERVLKHLRLQELYWQFLRLHKGPADKSDIAAYRECITRFQELIREFKVINIYDDAVESDEQIRFVLSAFEKNIAEIQGKSDPR